MRKFTSLKMILVVTFVLFACTKLSAQLLVENFDYTVGSLLSANGWSAHSGAGTNSPAVATSTITYTGYTGSGVGGQITLATSGEDVNRALSSTVTSGSVYASFLVNFTSATTGGDYFVHFAQTSGSTSVSIFSSRFYVKKDATDKLSFGIMKGSTAANIVYSDFNYSLSTTYLVVLKYSFVDGTGNDFCNMYVNPVVGQVEPATATISSNTTDNATTDLTGIASFCIRQGSSTTACVATLDAIRVGTSWTDVLGPISSVNNPTSKSGIYALNGEVVLTAESGDVVEVFSASGQRLVSVKAVAGENRIPVAAKGVVLVRAKGQMAKVVL